MSKPIIAWDFDGVLNRNIRDGRFLWAERFEEEIGHPLDGFVARVFGEGFDAVLTGREDLAERVGDWLRTVGSDMRAEALLDYWFRRDRHEDAEMLALMERLAARGLRQVMVTNNEPRRAGFIADQMGFADRVEHIFASGRIGLRKPDPALFDHVARALGAPPGRLLLVDDLAANVDAAKRAGWQARHFTDATRDAVIAELAAL